MIISIIIIIQRREPNSLRKDVYLFYRVESEKWCIGPNPVGTFCWIYCDSKTKTPWVKESYQNPARGNRISGISLVMSDKILPQKDSVLSLMFLLDSKRF